jgi:hypothetical protein
MCPRRGAARSNCQYHSPNAITLVSQIAAPVDSSGPASSPSVPATSPTTSRAADQPLAAVSNAVSVKLATRSGRDRLWNRRGTAINSAISRASSSSGSTHRLSRLNRSGSAS